MSANKKILYHDLREEARKGSLPALVGRAEELQRLERLVGRRVNNNAAIVAPAGSGKTALVWGLMRNLSRESRFDKYALLQLDAEHLADLDDEPALEERFSEALARIPSCVLFIDDIGREIARNLPLAQRVHRLYKPLLARPDVHLLFAMSPQEHAWMSREYPPLLQQCEALELKKQSGAEYARVLARKIPKLNAVRRRIVPDSALQEIVAFLERFPALGALPRAGIQLLDEALAASAARGEKLVSTETIARVVEEKTGVPRARLNQDELDGVKKLEHALNARVVDQTAATAAIAAVLRRAKLGLKDPNRPLGSFLLLGPSGVGKTETAKTVAEIMFGRAESFTRIDMSEFGQEHSVQRLIGAPPGYVGFDEGGALTNALVKEPYSLILLDEIEKAHPKVFDIFLQVLDDGRLTSGQNETVDAKNAIVMATSNAAVSEILAAHETGRPLDAAFVKEIALPILAKTFRLEFINRFDAILIFQPLAIPSLLAIAELEMRKIEQRLAKHRVRFELEPAALRKEIARLADPRFGARPVKRFVEDTCETLLMRSLLGDEQTV